tara:strand:- start:929 stop:1072 length:144 start_codon:yes stop_codon:yes gene_type:complete
MSLVNLPYDQRIYEIDCLAAKFHQEGKKELAKTMTFVKDDRGRAKFR